MKLQAQVGESTHQVEIIRTGDRVVAKIDDREYDLEASEPEPNVFLFKANGKIHEFFVTPNTSAESPTIVSSRCGDIEVKLIDPKRLRGSVGAGGAADGLAEIRTMMPGKVVRLVAKTGDEVAKGSRARGRTGDDEASQCQALVSDRDDDRIAAGGRHGGPHR